MAKLQFDLNESLEVLKGTQRLLEILVEKHCPNFYKCH